MSANPPSTRSTSSTPVSAGALDQILQELQAIRMENQELRDRLGNPSEDVPEPFAEEWPGSWSIFMAGFTDKLATKLAELTSMLTPLKSQAAEKARKLSQEMNLKMHRHHTAMQILQQLPFAKAKTFYATLQPAEKIQLSDTAAMRLMQQQLLSSVGAGGATRVRAGSDQKKRKGPGN